MLDSIEQYKEKLQEFRYDYNNPPEEKDPLISIIDDNREVPILHKQSFLCVYGKTGVRKSTFMNILVAAKYTDRFPRIKNYSTGVTIYIDTEQSGIEFWEMQRKLRFMWGEEGNQEDIMSYNLVPFPTLGDKRLAIKAALEICRDMNKDVSLLVIDGFKDLVGDSNDEKESKEVIEEIRALQIEYDFGLVTVLHTDKKGMDMVGRLGTLLKEKSSYSLELKELDYTGETEITAGKKRRGDFESFTIRHDQDGNVVMGGLQNPIVQDDQNIKQGSISGPVDDPPF